ncbi:MAG: hypothetical protein CSA35_03675 [Dethiosulfovibrio peptidovorans]|nr:MAG: hypothetical protein CSA35_03675 [Dethiosulfovibrio peptidovorans]
MRSVYDGNDEGLLYFIFEDPSSSSRIFRFFMALLMIGTLAGSGFAFYQMQNVVTTPEKHLPPVQFKKVTKEREALETKASIYKGILARRRDSQNLAEHILSIERNPLAKLRSPSDLPLATPEPSAADLEALPPLVVVRAVMVMPGKAAAVVDIDGVGQGIVVRKGTSFSGGKGRFLSIRAKKIVFRWRGKPVSVPVEL